MGMNDQNRKGSLSRRMFLKAPLLGNYGAADAGIPVDDVRKLEEELKKNNKTFDIKIYPESGRS